MTLQQLLAEAALCPRRERAALLAAGAVTVDGQVVTDPAFCPPEGATVCLQGRVLQRREPLVVMLHKPAGYLTATQDAHCPTVLELLPPALGDQYIFPIGRLDKETEGLLLLTNDGRFAQKLLHPAQPIAKTYYAAHYGEATAQDVAALAAGCTLRDGLSCAPAQLLPLGPGRSLVRVFEGKRHQVRRMLWDRHLHVRYLKRLAIGALSLGDLPAGHAKPLSPEEQARIFAPPEALAQFASIAP